MRVTAFPYLYHGFYAISIWWKNFVKNPFSFLWILPELFWLFWFHWKIQQPYFEKHKFGSVLENLNRLTSVVFKSDRKDLMTSCYWIKWPYTVKWVEWTAGSINSNFRYSSSFFLFGLLVVNHPTQGITCLVSYSVFAIMSCSLFLALTLLWVLIFTLLLSFIIVPLSHFFELTYNNCNKCKFMWSIMADDVKYAS